MKLSDFYYCLPEELIAQTPVYPRDSSRLMVYNRCDKQIMHKHFYDIVNYISAGDVLVLNETKVIPARLLGVRENSSIAVEFLLLKRKSIIDWEIICKPARRLKIGSRVIFSQELTAVVQGKQDDGITHVRFEFEGIFEEILDLLGQMPLPPYITQKLADKSRYQTVYASIDGSSAAPTAGLHFTGELIEKLEKLGIIIVKVLLHVGLGTFRPVKEENILNHKMHSEYYELSPKSAQTINDAKRCGGKIFAVGTTSVRILETCANDDGLLFGGSGETDIFIYPGYSFKAVDALITNFHLSESTLLMLVSAFAGREAMRNCYQTAIINRYRFFSFGDAMLIL